MGGGDFGVRGLAPKKKLGYAIILKLNKLIKG